MKWKWIDGYDKDYKICENGEVISCKYNKERILKPCINTQRYLIVCLCKNNKQKNFLIHRLIALHFIENPNNYDCVDHINGNTKDNRIKNLRWITHSGNMRNRKNTGRYLKGVYFHKASNKFKAEIRIDNKRKYLGLFHDELDAHQAYMKEYNEIMKEFDKIKI